MLQRPAVSGVDAVTTLRHFALVTYAVPPERLQPLLHPRFELDCISLDGQMRALLSVVPFEDQDFRAAAFPSPRLRFGQTNYRIYIRERQTGTRAVWFLGTTLGSWSVALPRYLWRLPWHYGRFRFECEQESSGRYSCFKVATESRWASAMVELEDTGGPLVFDGFPDIETGLVVLTHPLTGYFTRRDGHLGSYAVWHERLTPSAGRVRSARWDLLDRLGIVPFEEQHTAYSVLIQPRTEFIVQLPPRRVGDEVD
ncbi:MAG: DUF2071 domain-containing protein [Planctomycetota bacterium]